MAEFDHVGFSGNSIFLKNKTKFTRRAFNHLCNKTYKELVVKTGRYTCRVMEGDVGDLVGKMDGYIQLYLDGEIQI